MKARKSTELLKAAEHLLKVFGTNKNLSESAQRLARAVQEAKERPPLSVPLARGERLYSNPIQAYMGKDYRYYTFEPDGDIPFCVRFSLEHWIPVNVMVFSDSPKHAMMQVDKALRWRGDGTRTREDTRKVAKFLRTCKKQVQQVEPNQIFSIGWAGNDTIGVAI
jgi:hypothetical protein